MTYEELAKLSKIDENKRRTEFAKKHPILNKMITFNPFDISKNDFKRKPISSVLKSVGHAAVNVAKVGVVLGGLATVSAPAAIVVGGVGLVGAAYKDEINMLRTIRKHKPENSSKLRAAVWQRIVTPSSIVTEMALKDAMKKHPELFAEPAKKTSPDISHVLDRKSKLTDAKTSKTASLISTVIENVPKTTMSQADFAKFILGQKGRTDK